MTFPPSSQTFQVQEMFSLICFLLRSDGWRKHLWRWRPIWSPNGMTFLDEFPWVFTPVFTVIFQFVVFLGWVICIWVLPHQHHLPMILVSFRRWRHGSGDGSLILRPRASRTSPFCVWKWSIPSITKSCFWKAMIIHWNWGTIGTLFSDTSVFVLVLPGL